MILFRSLGVLTAILSISTRTLAQDTQFSHEEENRPSLLVANAPEDGSGEGLTLDVALDLLLTSNDGLRARAREIPEARADELTASLRNAPALFFSGNQLPYEHYSAQRPGVAGYEVSPAQNIDYSGKRSSHMRQTSLVTRQVEALYQNAVREGIDHLYDDFLEVLEAGEAVRAARTNFECLRVLVKEVRQRKRPDAEEAAAAVRRFNAATAVEEAEGHLLRARRHLAELLALPTERADSLEVCGSLHDHSPPPPCVEELVSLALGSRPDLTAQRIGVQAEEAGVRVERAERFDDAIAFYSPYEVQDFSPQGKRSATDWGGGAGTSLPILDRNQGEIARARIRVSQARTVLQGLERNLVNAVRQAHTEYEASQEAVHRYEREGLPAIARLREDTFRRYAAGGADVDSVLDVQQEYHEEMGRYREALARHRRSMLRLNTVLGQRLLP